MQQLKNALRSVEADFDGSGRCAENSELQERLLNDIISNHYIESTGDGMGQKNGCAVCQQIALIQKLTKESR